MTTMGLEYNKYMETQRHNKAMEGFEDRNSTVREKDAETNRLNYGVNLMNADSNQRNARSNERQAGAAEVRAANDTMRVGFDKMNAESTARNADSNARLAGVQEGRLALDTNRYTNVELPKVAIEQQKADAATTQAGASVTSAEAAALQAAVANYLSKFKSREVTALESKAQAAQMQAGAQDVQARNAIYQLIAGLLPTDTQRNAVASQIAEIYAPEINTADSAGAIFSMLNDVLSPLQRLISGATSLFKK